MARRLRPILLLAGLGASAVLTYLALRDVDFDGFVDALGGGDPMWLGASFLVFVGAYALRIVRWRLLFEPSRRPPLRSLVRPVLAGEFFTSLLPALRLGELARVVLLHRATRIPRADALGTVVAERVHDVAALLVLLFLAVPFVPPVTWLRGAAVMLALVASVILLAVVSLNRFGSRPIGFLLRPLALVPGFSRARTELAAAGVLRGLGGLQTPRVALTAFGLSVLSWCGIALSFVLALRVVGIEVGLAAGILVAVATSFSLLLPSLPASVGIFEAAVLVALAPYDVNDARALSGAVVIHVMSFVPFLVAGPLALRGHAVRVRSRLSD